MDSPYQVSDGYIKMKISLFSSCLIQDIDLNKVWHGFVSIVWNYEGKIIFSHNTSFLANMKKKE